MSVTVTDLFCGAGGSSTGDALTQAGVIADDARIVAVGACKVETAGWTGAQIVVREHPTFDTEPSA